MIIFKFCEICHVNENEKKFKYYCHPIKTSTTNELWEMEIIGPINVNETGSMYINTCIDMFSKRAECIESEFKSAVMVCNFLDKLIKKFGAPRIILTENNFEFANKILKTCVNFIALNIEQGRLENPTTQGGIERFNKNYVSELRKICYNNKDN